MNKLSQSDKILIGGALAGVFAMVISYLNVLEMSGGNSLVYDPTTTPAVRENNTPLPQAIGTPTPTSTPTLTATPTVVIQ